MADECMSERQNMTSGLGEANSWKGRRNDHFLGASRHEPALRWVLGLLGHVQLFCPSEIYCTDTLNHAFSYVMSTLM